MFEKNTFISNANKTIFNNRGSSYIELLYVIVTLIIIMTILFQVYFIVQGEIMVINVTKYALRQLELTGGDTTISVRDTNGNVTGTIQLRDEVVSTLSKNTNIDIPSLSIRITDRSDVPVARFQLREPIKVKIVANYKVFGTNIPGFTVPLSCTYIGSSQKYDKNLNGGNFDMVVE